MDKVVLRFQASAQSATGKATTCTTMVRHPLKAIVREAWCKPKCITAAPPVCVDVAKMAPTMPAPAPKSWLSSAGWGLAILSFINLFNYLDRYLVPALFESLKHSELRLTDAQLGS